MKLFAFILLAGAVAMLCRYASAQTTATTDPVGFYQFPFPTGTGLPGQTESNGMTWAAAGPAGPPITIAANSLAVAGLASPAGNKARLAGADGPAARIGLGSNFTTGTLYYSLALNVASLGALGDASTSVGSLAGFDDATGPSATLPVPLGARLLIGGSTGGYQLGLAASSFECNCTDCPRLWPAAIQPPNQTVFVVCSYSFNPGEGNDTVRLWINPDAATFGRPDDPPPNVTATVSNDMTQIASFVLMQHPEPILPAVTFVDEVRVGPTWASVTPPEMDFGDAPEGAFPYPTTLSRNGARHGGGPLFFGAAKDLEADGNPTVPADGDDTTGVPNDEDGIVFGGTWTPGGSAWVDITVSAAGRVDAWSDWNQMSAWEPAEKIIDNQPVTPGAPVRFMFTVPPGSPPGQTYARFRLSNAGGLAPVGFAPDGEVQDYRVEVLSPPDLRLVAAVLPNLVIDTSNFTYSVTVSNGGASVATDTLLTVPLPTGLTFTSAMATQGSCSNSTSGVVCNLGTLQSGGTATVNVVCIPDFNQLATALNIPDTQETIEVSNTVAVTSLEVDAAPADNIAVVVVPIVPLRDFGDAPQPPYPTLLLPNGARHRVGNLRFGTLLDAEPNGQPVDQDDVIGVADEVTDGFGLPAGGLYAGGWTAINIQVSGAAGGYIDMWIDVDGVPGWGAADHVVAAFFHPGGGAVVAVPVAIPPGAVIGPAWARARVHKNPAGLPPGGYGGFGEVVDFQVNILPAAVDLVVAANPAFATLTEGDSFTVTITASNKGPSTATSVQLISTLASNVIVTSVSNSAGGCQVQGSNIVCTVSSLAAQQSFTVTVTASNSLLPDDFADELADGGYELYFCPVITSAEPDLNAVDNVAQMGAVVFVRRDFGDAPDATVGPSYAYPTRMVDNGARHRIAGPYFGDSAPDVDRDRDPDGMPTLNADGDDLLDTNDDEEGIQFLDPIFPGATGVRVRINAPLGGRADAWVDFERNGMWTMGAPEQIFTSLALTPGTFEYTFNVPAGAVVGATYARFRISNLGGLAFTGYATNGEVQDLPLLILPTIDIDVVTVGDPTVQLNEDEPYTVKFRVTNKGSNTANNVQFTATLPPDVVVLSATSSNGICQVTGSNVTCQIAILSPGQSSLKEVIMTGVADTLPGEDFYDLGDLTIMATAAEIDLNLADNQIAVPAVVLFARDWGDAPMGYPVTNAEMGARHRRKSGFFLGAAWDRNANGFHSPNTDFDDLNGTTPDDEDGVSFPIPIAPGAPCAVIVTASAPGFLDAWMNFNGDLDWADADEQIFASQALVAGSNTLTFNVPPSAVAGITFSRWRFSETGGLTDTGTGGKGEVEDHLATIAARLDFGDAPEIIPGAPAVATTYEVTLGRDGGRHDDSALRLGNEWDAEIDGQPNVAADLDDTTGVPDDEDGWTPVPFVAGTMMNLTVYVSSGGGGLLDIWVDWDHNYNWDVPEHQVMAFAVAPGANTVPINVPGGIPNGQTYARFRLSTLGSTLPSGYALDGEVEDYVVTVTGGIDNENQVYFAGLGHTASSNATMSVNSNGLTVANIGSSGQDGVAINLGAAEGWQGTVEAPLSPLTSSNGSKLGWSLLGTVNGTSNQLATVGRMEIINGAVNVFADFSALGASNNLVRAYINDEMVASNVVPATAAAFRFANGEWPPSLGIGWHTPIPEIEALTAAVSWDGGPNGGATCMVSIANGPLITSDSVTVTPISATAPVRNLSRVSLYGYPGDFVLLDEAIGLFGVWHRGLTDVHLDLANTIGPPTLRVGNIGSSGEDGIEVIAGGRDIWDLGDSGTFTKRVVKEFPDNSAPGFTLPGLGKFTATGRVQGSSNSFENLSDLTSFRQEQGTASKLTVNFAAILGITQVEVDVFDHGTPVGIVMLPVGQLGTLNSTGRVSSLGFFLSPTTVCWRLRTEGVATFTPVTGAPLTGTFFRFGAVSPQATVLGLRSLITRAANTGPFTLRNAFHGLPAAPRLGLNLQPGSAPRLMVPTDSHAIYRVEFTGNLNGAWTPLGMIGGTGGDVEFTDPTGPAGAVRFYRVGGE